MVGVSDYLVMVDCLMTITQHKPLVKKKLCNNHFEISLFSNSAFGSGFE